MPEIININPLQPDPSIMETAVYVLKQGGIIAYPTETFYALGADALLEKAVLRLFEIKGRDFNNPIALIGSGEQDLPLITDNIPEAARSLIAAFWPGPLTLIFQASKRVLPRLTAGTGKIGMRVSNHPIARGLAAYLGHPVTATSANLSGNPECTTAQEVSNQIGPLVDLIIDGGQTQGGKGSTMLDVTVLPPVILREGALSQKNISSIIATKPIISISK
ncbi:MAG: Threonylcarbamoyl-AMP synthase [Syntrophus sp. SKADARSKE-3]|nr:Threonylcarbamoyl-AMP synthase [Syntrophus sp. SKADARSKE-3]